MSTNTSSQKDQSKSPIKIKRPVVKSECVRVVMRCRPLSDDEKRDKREMVVDMNRELGSVTVTKKDTDKIKRFTYDSVYPPGTEQLRLYDETARPIVESVLQGYNGTIFAYGQTGTGKTYTMEGIADPEDLKGIVPRTFDHIFDHIARSDDTQYLVRCSFCEIYNNEIHDLTAPQTNQHLKLKEDKNKAVYVQGLHTEIVSNVAEIQRILDIGSANRTTGETKMNRTSSRSHCIFQITIENSKLGADLKQHFRVGKLNMVDLAGSERQAKTEAQGVRLLEATRINLSLSALGNVISALTNSKATHVPYRDSPLTRLLEDSLGGNTKTVMIANVGPADWNFDETVTTCRFADRAKQIKNKPHINEDPKDAMLREFQEEIERLKDALAASGPATAAGTGLASLQRPKLEPKRVVVEKVVEKIVHKKGVSEQKVLELKQRTEKEKQAMEAKIQQERETFLAQATEATGKSSKLAESLQSKQLKLQQEREERENMQSKLADMEARLLHGSKIMDLAKRQELELRESQERLRLKQIEQENIQRELLRKEEEQLQSVTQYEDQEKIIQVRLDKLQYLKEQLHDVQCEVEDVQAEFQEERDTQLQRTRDLQRELQLKNLILEHFIDPIALDKINKRVFWDEDINDWKLMPPDLENTMFTPRPVSAHPGERDRPVSQYAKIASMLSAKNPRYRYDNIIELELDFPERTTNDYAIIEEAVQEYIQSPPRNSTGRRR